MTEEGRREAVAEELALAAEEIAAADDLLAGGKARIAVARAYFALFHAIRAQLYAEGLEPRTHGGVLTLYNLHFVKAGRYPTATARLVARMQKYREEADYGRGFVVDVEGAREELAASRDLVERIVAKLGHTSESTLA